MATRYLEDYPVGSVAEFGEIHVTEDEIRAFATRYDPQPFHIDPEQAKRWPYGGLIASGWHTASMMMRVVVEHFIDGESSLGSPGLGPIRWNFRSARATCCAFARASSTCAPRRANPTVDRSPSRSRCSTKPARWS